MKSMTRKELADGVGVTTTTLRNWMKPHMKKLIELGLSPRGILRPNVVAWIVHHFDIDGDDK